MADNDECLWQMDEENEWWWVACKPDEPLGFGEAMVAENFTYCPYCGRKIQWGVIPLEDDDGQA